MGVPSVSYSASSATKHVYRADLSATPVKVFEGRGNLYGFLVDDNSGEDIFLQVYDSTSVDPNQLTSGNLAFVVRIKADQTFGKDVNDSPYHFFSSGCVVVVSKERVNKVALGAGKEAAAQFWYMVRTAPNP